MKSSAKGDGRIWLLAAAGAVLAVGSTLFLFHVPAGAPVPMKVEPLPGLTFRRQNEAGGADFYDPKPLFLPTEWNSRPNVLPNDTVREPGDNFRYEAKAAPEVNAASLAFPGKAEVPKRAVEAQDSWTQEAPFFGIGQTDGKIEPLPAREALIQVVAVSDGRPVFTHILPERTPPLPASAVGNRWNSSLPSSRPGWSGPRRRCRVPIRPKSSPSFNRTSPNCFA